MPTTTTNYDLILHNSTTDQSETFLDYRLAMNGPEATSNMMKIEAALTAIDSDADGVVDEAAAVAWTGVTGKPATFPSDAHTDHSSLNLGTATGAAAGDIKMSGSIRQSVPVACTVRRSTDQSINHNTWSPIHFDTVVTEQPSDLDMWAVANPTRLYARIAGRYLVSCHLKMDANTTGGRSIAVLKNAAGVYSAAAVTMADSKNPNIAAWNTDLLITSQVDLAFGDYIEMFAFQTSTAPLDALTDGTYTPLFAMTLLS
jgi:hypothetical protein